MRPALELLEGDRVALRAPKVVYVLTAAELLALLRLDVATWQRAITRGKAHRRGERTAARENAREAADAELGTG
jgi:hypothetical protein